MTWRRYQQLRQAGWLTTSPLSVGYWRGFGVPVVEPAIGGRGEADPLVPNWVNGVWGLVPAGRRLAVRRCTALRCLARKSLVRRAVMAAQAAGLYDLAGELFREGCK